MYRDLYQHKRSCTRPCKPALGITAQVKPVILPHHLLLRPVVSILKKMPFFLMQMLYHTRYLLRTPILFHSWQCTVLSLLIFWQISFYFICFDLLYIGWLLIKPNLYSADISFNFFAIFDFITGRLFFFSCFLYVYNSILLLICYFRMQWQC